MAETHTPSSEELGALHDELDGAGSHAKAHEDMACGGESGNQAVGDSTRFQRFEAARKRRVEPPYGSGRVIFVDGFRRYADKPFTPGRPRDVSPQLMAFYIEIELGANQ